MTLTLLLNAVVVKVGIQKIKDLNLGIFSLLCIFDNVSVNKIRFF